MKKYEGKNAWWFIAIVVCYNIFPFGTFMDQITRSWFAVFIALFYYAGNLLMIPIIIQNKIELYDDYFLFYYGFSKQRIELSSIKQIEKSHNVIASSANSLDRIYIQTKDTDLYVSLKKNREFIEEIKRRIDN